MDDLRPVLWRQGLFLTPQHLQQQDRAAAGTAAEIGRCAPGFPWGVGALRIRPEALERGLVEVTDVVAITPEQVLLSAGTVPGIRRNARIRTRQVPWPSSTGAVEVHLCLARETDDASPLGDARDLEGQERIPRRYLVEEAELPDRFDRQSRSTARVQRLAYLAQLTIMPVDARGDAARHGMAEAFDSLPIARLLPKSEGFELDPSFVPPSLTLEAAPMLVEAIRSIANRMLGVIAEVAPEPSARGLRVELGLPQNLPVFLLLRSLHEHASALLQTAELRRVPPADAYFRLRQAIADLAAYSPTVSVLGEVAAGEGRPVRGALPPYNHANAGPGFAQALAALSLLLDGIRGGPQVSVELSYFPPSTWRAELSRDFLEGRLSRFFLRVECPLPPSQVRERLREAKFASRPEMPTLIDKRLFGVPLALLADAPPGLPVSPGRFTYFEFDRDHDDWKRIMRDRTIEALCPDLPPEARLRIYREYAAR